MSRRRHRPAPGQMEFGWLAVEIVLAVELPIAIQLPQPPPAPEPLPAAWWRRRRPGASPRPPVRSADRDERQIDRWLRKGVGCCLCHAWPAPCDCRVGGRLLLLCQRCDGLPNSLARLAELVRVDWAATAN